MNVCHVFSFYDYRRISLYEEIVSIFVETEIAHIRYQCKYCQKKRDITANKELLLNEILMQGGNGLARVIDQHVCDQGVKEFILLQVDSNFSVRGQSKFTDLFEKEERNVKQENDGGGLVIPIPGGIESISTSVTEVKIPDYPFTTSHGEFYVYYHDKRKEHKVILNDDQKPEAIKRITSKNKKIKIEFDPKDRLLERWLFYLLAINEDKPPETLKELLFQFMYIQEKRFLNRGPVSMDLKTLTLIGHMSQVKFSLKYVDHMELFKSMLHEVFTGFKYDIAKEILDTLNQTTLGLEAILKKYLVRASFMDLLDILNEMKKNGIIAEHGN